ncbi:MAG: flagellar protein FliS [Devosia sp.]|nr:flagellar protein FliS [Devosia sp.]
MSNLNQALAAYRLAATQVPPLTAVVKLYDEALRRIGRAIVDTEERRIEEAYINISRASLILRGLSSNLRFDKGEELARMLKQTYVANMIALHTSFGKPDAVTRYRRIAGGLLELRNAWAEIAGEPSKTGEAPAPAPARDGLRPRPIVGTAG